MEKFESELDARPNLMEYTFALKVNASMMEALQNTTQPPTIVFSENSASMNIGGTVFEINKNKSLRPDDYVFQQEKAAKNNAGQFKRIGLIKSKLFVFEDFNKKLKNLKSIEKQVKTDSDATATTLLGDDASKRYSKNRRRSPPPTTRRISTSPPTTREKSNMFATRRQTLGTSSMRLGTRDRSPTGRNRHKSPTGRRKSPLPVSNSTSNRTKKDNTNKRKASDDISPMPKRNKTDETNTSNTTVNKNVIVAKPTPSSSGKKTALPTNKPVSKTVARPSSANISSIAQKQPRASTGPKRPSHPTTGSKQPSRPTTGSKQPSTSTGSKQPSTQPIAMKQPRSSTGNKHPSTIARKQPSSIAKKQPSSIAKKQPSSIARKQPSSVAMKQPSGIGGKKPSSRKNEINTARPKRNIISFNPNNIIDYSFLSDFPTEKGKFSRKKRPNTDITIDSYDNLITYRDQFRKKYKTYKKYYKYLTDNERDFTKLGELLQSATSENSDEIDKKIETIYNKRIFMVGFFREQYKILHEELSLIKENIQTYMENCLNDRE
eukprot:TRINITY_DN2204_c0_g1_i1.p1 TRINITY_DN2204_c0_g1~~TRINITY_DN2204_c0_g1_i1.p1  ORF type:complete len:557 (-),score=103.06 TRINITY_DN2204_c0_g1_i1:74-1717(-)